MDYQIEHSQQLELLSRCATLLPEYEVMLSLTQRASEKFSVLDGFLYFCMMKTHRPKRVVQIGGDILMDYISATTINQTQDAKLMWVAWVFTFYPSLISRKRGPHLIVTDLWLFQSR
jgi:hypothetical protein